MTSATRGVGGFQKLTDADLGHRGGRGVKAMLTSAQKIDILDEKVDLLTTYCLKSDKNTITSSI